MRAAKLYKYTLPMDSGVVLRENKLTERTGWIIELHENGKIARGEVAPLIGFSQESLDEAGIAAQCALEAWFSGHKQNYDELPPSVAFGFSMALTELEGKLPRQGNYVAAPLCTGDPDEIIESLSAMPGKRVAKVKVGLYEPIRDGMLVDLMLESIPDLTLRLDANRAWTKEQAMKFASYISPSLRQRIEFLEEPCANPADSLAFAIDTGIAIGWDETLQQEIRHPDFALEELTGVKAIVIKPTLIGSIERCKFLVEKAHKLGMHAVISSSIESSLGLNQLARLAHWITPDEVPGLDTISLYQAQLETPWPKSPLPLTTLDEHELVWSTR
ncbi:o-succinylbenzoate synthase [Vibrio maerlii]|uniref:o-succinylbenzoate synthase n=1 Tax=Vibrio maerlii TaxID=2231648 RepID=UPI000E3E2170|nr:o-succinylbenzoate synthase [Vibrio maerlii]